MWRARTIGGVLAAVALCAPAAAVATEGARQGEESPPSRQAYVSDVLLDPFLDDGDLHVAVASGQLVAHSLIDISFTSVDSAELIFSQTEDAADNAGADDASLIACPITEPWSVPVEEAPDYDCGAASTAGYKDDSRYVIDVTPLQSYWSSKPALGVAIVPAGQTASGTWQIAFDPSLTRLLTRLALTEAPQPSSPAFTQDRAADDIATAPSFAAEPWAPSGPILAPDLAPNAGPELAPAPSAQAPQLAPEAAASSPAAVSVETAQRAMWPLLGGWAVLSFVLLASRVPVVRAAAGGAARTALQRLRPGLATVSSRLPAPVGRGIGLVFLPLLAWAAADFVLPRGAPAGVVILGAVLGSLTALTALGLVLVYRVARVINMAQVEIGALASTTAVILVTGKDVPYFVAVPVGLALAILTGAAVERVVRRFARAPRVIVTVATIGIAQLLGGLAIGLPQVVTDLSPTSRFSSPLDASFSVFPVTFTGDFFVPLAVIPLVLVGLTLLLTKSDIGRALRALADSQDRAEQVGIPVRWMMRITWVIAAALSALAALMSTPILGPTLGTAAGPTALLAPLAAAVIGRMENLRTTFIASLAIGVLQQVVFWSFPRSSTVDVVLFVVILIGLFAGRRTVGRITDDGLGQYMSVGDVRPVPVAIARLGSVRAVRALTYSAVAIPVVAAPAIFGTANLIIITYIAVFAIVGVSLVVLTGWTGQVSLGQFAFAGVGAAMTATALTAHQLDMFLALASGVVIAALFATIVGLPTLRLAGQFAAVATLAFAVPVSTFLLNAGRFPQLNPTRLDRPVLLGRFPLDHPPTYYYVCLAALLLTLWIARNIRGSRFGRALLAVRDNENAASAWSISPTRLKLAAFAVSGGIAGLAGGLYVIGLRGLPPAGFSPMISLQIFSMVVVGGLGSLQGAVLGALYVGAVQSLLGPAAQLMATGVGLLILLLITTEGLGGLVLRVRDYVYGYFARRANINLNVTADGSSAVGAPLVDEPPAAGNGPRDADSALAWRGVRSSYGKLQVLQDVTGSVAPGETLSLLGTNGAGKSTLLRVLSGVMAVDQGQVTLDGEDITGLSPQQRLSRGMVTVPGGHGVFPSLTVEENFRLFAWSLRADGARVQAGIEASYTTFPRLRERRSERASQLSGGEQQMLALTQALICDARVVLIDELTLGLAPKTVAVLLDVLRRMQARGVTVVLVEQSLNTAASIGGRCLFMERGQIRYDGAIADLMARDDLARAVFLGGGDAARPAGRPATAGRDGEAHVVLEATGISKHFGGIAAIAHMNLTVTHGEVVGLIGPNGAGKTSLLDALSGFITPDTGRVQFAGVDVTALSPHERAAAGLGRVFQDARLVPSLTVREVLTTALERHLEVREPVACMLRLGATVASEDAARARVQELLVDFGLSGYADTFVRELSTGSRRVVELAACVAHRPTVLLLDEPTAGVAQKETEALAERILALRDELDLTLVVVEHDLSFIAKVADRLICMDQGAELASGLPGDVLQDPRVLSAYFGVEAGPGAPVPASRSDATPARGNPRARTAAARGRDSTRLTTPVITPASDEKK